MFSTKNIHADILATLVNDVPVLSRLQMGAAAFRRGRDSLEDEKRSVCPVIWTTEENNKLYKTCIPFSAGQQRVMVYYERC